jgi:hypothetical protein
LLTVLTSSLIGNTQLSRGDDIVYRKTTLDYLHEIGGEH